MITSTDNDDTAMCRVRSANSNLSEVDRRRLFDCLVSSLGSKLPRYGRDSRFRSQ